MYGWAQDAMREAIDLLARGGRNDIASDLNRVLSVIEFEELEILRHPESDRLADDITEVGSLSELLEALTKLAELVDADHCTLFVSHEAESSRFTTKVLTTYPDAWVARYVEKKYFYIDPLTEVARTREHPFFWESLQPGDSIAREFWKDAEQYGVGPAGYTIPLTTGRGDRVGLSFSSNEDHTCFRERLTTFEQDLYNLSIYFSDAFCSLASVGQPTARNLTDDQVMVLRAIAAGLSEEDLSQIRYTFGSFATVKQSICNQFQTKTLAQAAVLAVKCHLLDNVPYMKSDVLSAAVRHADEGHDALGIAQSRRKLARVRNLAALQVASESSMSPEGCAEPHHPNWIPQSWR